MSNKKHIELLQNIMKHNNLNQEQLATELKVSKQFISQLLLEKRNMGKNFLLKLAKQYPNLVDESLLDVNGDKGFVREARINLGYSQAKMANLLNISQSLYAKFETGERTLSDSIRKKLKDLMNNPSSAIFPSDIVSIRYCPHIRIPAQSNLGTLDERFVQIDRTLLNTDKSLHVRPEHCVILRLSGDCLSPLYESGDMFVLDMSFNAFKSDYIHAFVINGQCYIRRIQILPDKVKCISVNENQDTFYLNNLEGVNVLGLIVPRLRF